MAIERFGSRSQLIRLHRCGEYGSMPMKRRERCYHCRRNGVQISLTSLRSGQSSINVDTIPSPCETGRFALKTDAFLMSSNITEMHEISMRKDRSKI